MRIHHLSCGTMCPFGRRFLQGDGGLLAPGEICCHCLLIESVEGLVLVDAGLSQGDLDPKRSRLPWKLRALLRPELDPTRSALHQVEKLGFSARDVRHIVVTHLDFDHAGGLVDFPEAQVHVFADEQRAALAPNTWLERDRYPAFLWAHQPRWTLYDVAGESFFGFEAVRALSARETDVLLVPLRGHTRGHVGVAVKHGDGYLLHCGDAYFHHDELAEPPHCPPGLALFQRLMAHDDRMRLQNQARLRALKGSQGPRIQLFSAHDPSELARLRDASGPAVSASAVQERPAR